MVKKRMLERVSKIMIPKWISANTFDDYRTVWRTRQSLTYGGKWTAYVYRNAWAGNDRDERWTCIIENTSKPVYCEKWELWTHGRLFDTRGEAKRVARRMLKELTDG